MPWRTPIDDTNAMAGFSENEGRDRAGDPRPDDDHIEALAIDGSPQSHVATRRRAPKRRAIPEVALVGDCH